MSYHLLLASPLQLLIFVVQRHFQCYRSSPTLGSLKPLQPVVPQVLGVIPILSFVPMECNSTLETFWIKCVHISILVN